MIHFMLPMLLLAQDVDEVELPPELTGEFVPKPGFKLYGEYLVWWLRRAYAPPILTAGTAASQGVLGQPGTRVIYGDEWLETRHDDRFIGGRFGAEWMHRSGEFGLEGRAFFLERDSTYKTIKWRTDPLMALSYKDASTGRESSIVISGEDATRGLLSGGFVGYSRVELFGQEINGVVPLRSHGHWKVDALAGARFLQLRDRYHHTATNWETPANQVLTGIIDNYRYHNAFYGGQIGLKGESQWNRVSLQARGTIALGADAQTAKIWGESIVHTPTSRTVTPTGLYVQRANTGTFTNCNFDAVGEVAVNLGFDFTHWLRGYMGYTFLYWADPVRAASQVQRNINFDNQPVTFNGDPVWAQGMNFGFEIHW